MSTAKENQISRDGLDVPTTISTRTEELAPLLMAWRRRNRRVPWSCLLQDALRDHLSALAGKRHAHLVTGQNGKERAA
jgi:hypothetical protein